MKNWTYILAVILILACGISNKGWSVQSSGIVNPGIVNPGIRNPAGMSTVPPSSLQDGLVTSPNPFGQIGNDMMTGNLRRGRSFRGGLPYRSGTTFMGHSISGTEAINLVQVGGPLTRANTTLGPTPDTASLDSFLRDSAGWEDFGTYSGKYGATQYYSRKNTVPTTRPGHSGVFKPTQSGVSGRAPDVFGLEVLDTRRIQQQKAEAENLAMRPTPLTPDEIQRLASGQARISPDNAPVSAELYQKKLEQIRQDLVRMRTQKPPAQFGEDEKKDAKKDAEKEALLRILTKPGDTAAERDEELARTRTLETPFERVKRLEKQAIEEQKQRKTKQDVGDVEKVPLEKLLPSYEKEKPGDTLQSEARAVEGMTDIERLTERIANIRRKDSGAATYETMQTGVEGVEGTDAAADKTPNIAGLSDVTFKSYKDLVLRNNRVQTDRTTLPTVDKVTTLSDEEIASRARQIMRGYKSHESFSKARFEKYMAEAKAYMKQGKYYQAISAYEQAAIFHSKDPETMAGKSLALFGAGEYVSSALFLSRAIELSPKYLNTKVDPAAAMGDKNKFETRIADTEDWFERSGAPELEFLLAYMHYRNGKLELAKKAITIAAKEMPESKAVKILKEAIEAAPKAGKRK